MPEMRYLHVIKTTLNVPLLKIFWILNTGPLAAMQQSISTLQFCFFFFFLYFEFFFHRWLLMLCSKTLNTHKSPPHFRLRSSVPHLHSDPGPFFRLQRQLYSVITWEKNGPESVQLEGLNSWVGLISLAQKSSTLSSTRRRMNRCQRGDTLQSSSNQAEPQITGAD